MRTAVDSEIARSLLHQPGRATCINNYFMMTNNDGSFTPTLKALYRDILTNPVRDGVDVVEITLMNDINQKWGGTEQNGGATLKYNQLTVKKFFDQSKSEGDDSTTYNRLIALNVTFRTLAMRAEIDGNQAYGQCIENNFAIDLAPATRNRALLTL